MPLDTAPALAQHHDALLTQHLRSFLGDIEPAALALLRERLTWVEIAGGHTLIEQGAPGDSMYLSISGRLRAYVRDDDGVPRMVREMGRGQVVGEMSLYTDEPRSASVVAIRDSVLVRLDKAHFAELLALSPQVSIGADATDHPPPADAEQRDAQRSGARLPVTIGLLPVSDGIDLRRFADRLAAQLASKGRVVVLDSAAVDAALGRARRRQRPGRRRGAEPAHLAAARQHRGRARVRAAARRRDAQRHGRAAAAVTATSCCCWPMRRSRRALHAIETDWLTQRPPHAEAAEILVLLHPADSRCPRDTRAWLARRPVTDARAHPPRARPRHGAAGAHREPHRRGPGAGRRRRARLRPPGRVSSALQEHGIEVDFVGGTSIGAVMAALVAADQPLDADHRDHAPRLQRQPDRRLQLAAADLADQAAGACAASSSRAMTELLGFARRRRRPVEELLLHRHQLLAGARAGDRAAAPLLEALLASTAIPGALPPVVARRRPAVRRRHLQQLPGRRDAQAARRRHGHRRRPQLPGSRGASSSTRCPAPGPCCATACARAGSAATSCRRWRRT